MIDTRARKAHSIFVGAIDLEPPDREAFVAGECESDPALRREVDQLLRAIDQSTDFLEAPAIGSRTGALQDLPASTVPELPGYEFIRTLGVGGMASVFEAEQTNPRRRVALKVMHRSLADTSAQQRFRLEAEILARLRHPGIAQIYEAGTYEDAAGRTAPYFTMELVEDGQSITEYAAARGLSINDRLELFVDLCDAITRGHQGGVIHRDLKPSNVLVDQERRVKVIDFGIARSLGTVEDRITLDSDRQRLMGTLNYMSPEQCSGVDRVDTRADVYALGVMLYELVTGQLPHDLTKTSIPQAARIIESENPASPHVVAPAVRGDLELIILTAIEKDPKRRYLSAVELGADLRRYLSNQPIQARPATALYRAHKFAIRHRPLVAGALSAFLVLVAGVAATSWMAFVANEARRAAEERERELEQVTEFQRSQLSGIDVSAMGGQLREALIAGMSERGEARTDPADALGSINFTTLALNMLEDNVFNRSRMAIDERFVDQPQLRARLLQTLAGTMNTLGLPEQAMPVLASALEIRRTELGPDHPDTLISKHSMGSLLGSLGRYEESLEYLIDTLDSRRRVFGPENHGTLTTADTLAGLYRRMGRHEEAEALWEDTLVIRRRVYGDDHPDTMITLNNVGVIHAVKGEYDEAELAWRELLERRKRVYGEDHPAYRNSLTNLGLLLVEQGKLEEAKHYLELSLEALLEAFGAEHPSTLSTMSSLANLLVDLGDAGAEPLLRRCAETRTSVLGPDHPDSLRSRARMASYRAAGSEAQNSLEILERILADQRGELGSDHPDTIESMQFVATVLLEVGRTGEALELAAEGAERARALRPAAHRMNAPLLYTLAASQRALGRHAQAAQTLLEAHAGLAESLGESNALTINAKRKLQMLYLAWHEVDPSGGYDQRAERWRAP